MPLAESNRVKLRFHKETAWGETVTGNSTELLVTSESLTHNKETQISQTIRSDRQRVALLEVANSAGGDIGFELAYTDYESFFESALRNTISSATVVLASAVFAASSITGQAGTNFITSFAVGQWVKIQSTGYNEDSAIIKITALTSTILTVTGSTLTVSTAVSAAITGRTLINGTTKESLFIEADFDDITAVKYFTGMRVDSMSIDIAAQQIINGTFSFIGKQGFSASVSVASVTTSAAQQTAMTAAANVGAIHENNVLIANTVQALSFTVGNNTRARPQLGSKFSANPGDGGVDVSGNLTVYMEDKTLYDKMLNHTASKLSVRMTDTDSNTIVASFENVFFGSGDPNAPGQDQDVFLSLDFTAIRDNGSNSTIRLDFLPA